jgi:ATP-dependent DNA helicase RecQ
VLLYSAGDVIKWERIIKSSAAEAPEPGVWLEASMKLLTGMSRFAGSAQCRHRALSQYFGQQYGQASCGACDVCLEEVDAIPESTTVAQKIISCVARAQQRFGIGQIVDILLGAETENIRRYRHDQLSTYGILKELDKKSLTALVYQLVEQGLLARSGGEYPVLQLNAASVEVMKGERKVKLIRPAKKTKKRSARGEADLTGVDAGLFEHLRHWRRELAASHGVPPYVIFPDTTLVALSRMRPTTVAGLFAVPGIGDKKAAAYGKAICGEIVRYCREHGVGAGADAARRKDASARETVFDSAEPLEEPR